MKNFTKTMIVFWTLIFAQYTSAQCTTTETFNATGSLQNWTVPSGITSITVEAAGADGGNIGGFIGGNGARLVGTFSVVPGEQLQIIAGTRGNNHPGFPTLGSGAGGGGATFVARGNSGFSNFSTENLLLVAGGGGGAGTLSDGEGSDVLSLLPFGFGGLPGVGAILASGGGGTNLNDGLALASPNAGGKAAINGAAAGISSNLNPNPFGTPTFVNGGFGGGGAAGGSGGGGGGFSGGSGGLVAFTGASSGTSKNFGTNTSFFPASNNARGFVSITYFLDTNPPVPNVATLPNITAQCVVTSLTAPTALDECAGTIIGTSSVTLPITSQGTTIVTWTYNDGNGNSSTQNQNIIINDTNPPVPNIATLPNITAQCVVTSLTAPTALDACAGTITGTSSVTLPINTQGTTVVTWTYDDGNGNAITQNQNVIIEDNEAPIAICAAPFTIQLDANGQASISASDIDFGSTDNCGIDTITISQTDFDCLHIGDNTIILTVTDINGNVATCNTVITVEDTIAPILIAPADITVDTDAGVCFASNIDLGSPTVTENCEAVLIAWDMENALPLDTTVPPSFTTPLITSALLNGGQRVSNLLGSNMYLTRQFGSISKPVFNMNLTNKVYVNTFTFNHRHNHNPGFPTNPSYFAQLQVDAGGTGNYVDIGDPVLLSPATNGNTDVIDLGIYLPEGENKFRFNAVGLNGGTHTGTEFFAVDNVVITYSFVINNDAPAEFPVGQTTVTWTVTDGSGNTATDTQTVTVEDNEAPIAFCAAPFTIQLDANGQASISVSDIDFGSTDNCGIDSITISQTDFDCSNIGDNTVTLTVTDINGNSATCTTVVTVEDNIAPQIVCPNDIIINTEPGSCEATVFFGAATAFDACDGLLPTTQTAGPPSGSSFPIGDTTITFTATDSNGNTSSCDFTITVVDNQAPVAVCQNITIQLDANGLASITAEDLDGGSTDNCDSPLTFTASQTNFDCSHLGDNTITLTVTDAEGNSTTCTAIVTVEDSIAPVALCVAPFTIELDADGQATITVADVDAGSTDNCSIASITLSQSTFTCADLGENTITLTVTDVAGNSTTCTTTVTVEDNSSPIVSCIDFTLQLGADGTAFLTPADLGGTSTDNCAITITAIDIEEFDCSDIGTPVLVTYFASDASGNIASCTAMVTVVDTLGPVIDCPADQTVDTDTGSITYTVPDYFGEGLATATDNCTTPVTIFSQTPAPGTLLLDGTYTVTLTATDEYGNTSTCSFELTVDTILGAEDNTDFSSLTMYPNPAVNQVTIGNPQFIAIDKISVYDVQGRRVLSKNTNGDTGNQTINVSDLSSAVYMVVIESDGKQTVKRLIRK